MPTQEQIENWLVDQIAEILIIEKKEIDVRAPFSSYGLSSRDAVLLSGDMEDWLDRRLSPTIVYEYPSIETLAKHLSEDGRDPGDNLGGRQPQEDISEDLLEIGSPGSDGQAEQNLTDLVADLEQLSDDEVEARLIAKLNDLDRD
jgi:acyl carrier protein